MEKAMCEMKMKQESQTIEVEKKYEVTLRQKGELKEKLRGEGYTFMHDDEVTDVFHSVTKSPLGGYDFTRFRRYGDRKCVVTKKWWEKSDIPGKDHRREEEQEIVISTFKQAQVGTDLVLHKHRESWQGTFKDSPVTVDMDTMKVGEKTHYFVEVEIIAQNKVEAELAESLVDSWFRVYLEVTDQKQAPGMFTLLLQILGRDEP